MNLQLGLTTKEVAKDACAEVGALKRRVVLLEHAPGKLIGYTINLLKCAALAHPEIRKQFEVECIALSAEQYPLEKNTNTLNRKDNALLCGIVSRRIDVVGMSVFSWNVNYFARLSKILKLMAPHCKLVWGGKLASNDYERLAEQNPSVDCFCIGEGELVLQDYLLSTLAPNEPSEPLPGTYLRVGDRYYLGKPGRLPQLGSLPNPYIEGFIDSSMISQAYVETLRGCVYSCTFCDWGGKFYRTYDDDYIDKVIRKCLDLRFDVIFFMDSIFAVQPERRKRFLRTMIDHHNGHSQFGFELFIEHQDDESRSLLRELSSMNAISKIEIGLQSTSASTLKTIKRPHKRERFLERYFDLIRGMPALQQRIQMDLIIGLPGETWASYGQGINTVFSLDPGIISTFPLDIFPGGEMHQHQVEPFKLVFLDAPPYSIVSTSTLSAFEIQELMCLSWTFVSLREALRRSLFYLHHIVGEDIFSVMASFARWCVTTGKVSDWFDYGRVEEHTVNLVNYICSEEFSERYRSPIHLNRLKQILAFDLAPMMSVLGNQDSFVGVCHKAETGGHLAECSVGAETNSHLFAYSFSDLVLFEEHPMSNAVVLDTAGTSEILIVEVRGRSYRKWIAETEDWLALKSSLNRDHLYSAGDIAPRSRIAGNSDH
ncbi:radical SAM protein [Rhizobium mongolense]